MTVLVSSEHLLNQSHVLSRIHTLFIGILVGFLVRKCKACRHLDQVVLRSTVPSTLSSFYGLVWLIDVAG